MPFSSSRFVRSTKLVRSMCHRANCFSNLHGTLYYPSDIADKVLELRTQRCKGFRTSLVNNTLRKSPFVWVINYTTSPGEIGIPTSSYRVSSFPIPAPFPEVTKIGGAPLNTKRSPRSPFDAIRLCPTRAVLLADRHVPIDPRTSFRPGTPKNRIPQIQILDKFILNLLPICEEFSTIYL